MQSELKSVGCYKIDHIGIVVNDLEKAIKVYGCLFSCEIDSAVIHVRSQKIYCQYLFVPAINQRIQFIKPEDESSPVFGFLKKNGPGINHICYTVKSIYESVDIAKQRGFKVIVKPFVGEGVDNRKAAFIYNKDCGIIELVEDKTS